MGLLLLYLYGSEFFRLQQYITHVTEYSNSNNEQIEHGLKFFEIVNESEEEKKTGYARKNKYKREHGLIFKNFCNSFRPLQ